MAEEQQPVISEQDMPPMSAHSSPQDTHLMPPPAATTTYSGALPTHIPPLAQTPSNAIDPMRFTVLEGMVNQLAANMNTNMIKLMTMLRDQNRASSSYTPPPERRTTMHPNPVDSPIYATDSEDVSFSTMTYAPAVYPVTRRGKYLHHLTAHYGKLSRGIPVPPLSQFFQGPPLVVGGTSDDAPTESEDSSSNMVEAPFVLSNAYAIIEETSFGTPICRAQENEELNNWTAVPCYSAIVADV
ncbi:hypothetical protein CDL15_Pgr017205 [Punica granatum]|uniref:Uncharacterized protein n=1 Tax=Punica granatum TaxID=22663 RepID=A0A218WXP4_PUNGR|nr:hypothetical protein CDL15_Pgr017205 [Punica granatum]